MNTPEPLSYVKPLRRDSGASSVRSDSRPTSRRVSMEEKMIDGELVMHSTGSKDLNTSGGSNSHNFEGIKYETFPLINFFILEI